jgi:tryptophanyl-tRNA synthetase
MTASSTTTERKRVLSGIKPTGELHLGNYAGAIGPCIAFSQRPEYEMLLMCADWHGLTDRAKMHEPASNTAPALATFLALGFNPEGNSLFLQSDFPQIQENSWYLSCVTAVGMLERAHAYKDALASGKKPTGGLFYYPVLMASDIVSFDSELVPVGKDQAQHLEMMADIAQSFNSAVGEPVYKIAAPLIQDVPLLIGTDGERKMSKSYNNHIPLFAPKKEIEKRIKEIKTDSAGLDDVKDPATCPIFQILKGFGSPEAVAYMKERLEKGKGYGYGHAKMDLLAEHDRVFGSKRALYEDLLAHPEEMKKRMESGYARAEAYANQVRNRARDGLGLLRFRPGT